MSELALLYSQQAGDRPVTLAVPRGGVSRVYLPDQKSRAKLVTAVLKAQCGPGEELELLGEPVRGLRPAARERLRRRVAGLTPVVGLMSNLNAWENISLPAAYHGSPPLERVVQIAQEVLEAFGAEPRAFLARLPDELGTLERKIAAFVRLLIAAPEVALIDSLDAGLDRQERARVSGFEAEFRSRHPEATLLFVETREAEEDG